MDILVLLILAILFTGTFLYEIFLAPSIFDGMPLLRYDDKIAETIEGGKLWEHYQIK